MTMTDSQALFFEQNGYLIVPDVLSSNLVSLLNNVIDQDRTLSKLWQSRGNGRHQNPNLLMTTDAFDQTITHPSVLPIVVALMGPNLCFEEFSLMVRDPLDQNPPAPGWHRDTAHLQDHPYAVRNLSLIYYLTDVDESTHCFSVVPEGLVDKRKDPTDREAIGSVDLHGPAGTAILFNAGSVHDARQRETTRERRTIHIYYGHRDQPALSNHTLFPKRLAKGAHASLFTRPNDVSLRVHEVYE